MRRVKVNTYSGSVLETEIYTIGDRGDAKKACPRLRFSSDEERQIHREGISRRRFVRLVNNTFTPRGYYCTLTFDETHERRIFPRRAAHATTISAACFTDSRALRSWPFWDAAKNTSRIHLHLVAEGVTKSEIAKQWKSGEVKEIEPLREHNVYDGVDCGADYTGLANYLWRHWTPEQGGHRYKATRSCSVPKPDEPEVCSGSYGEKRHPEAPSGYIYIACQITTYGFMRFKYVRDPNAKTRRRR